MTCGDTSFSASVGHSFAAVAACLDSRLSSASRLSGVPVRPGNSGPAGRPARSSSQFASTVTVLAVSGVIRCLRPLSQRWDKGSYLDVSVMPTSA
jgi:hypothetical protein